MADFAAPPAARRSRLPGQKSLRAQGGVAIITALLLTTLAITIVASLFWQQQVQVRGMENQRLQLQTKWILRGALDWARLILREDGRQSRVDYLDEPWAIPLAETRLDQYVENDRSESDQTDAVLTGHILDAQALYNLGNLAREGKTDPAEVAAFARLLVILGLNPELATTCAGAMAAAQFAADLKKPGEKPAPPPVQVKMTQVQDLLALPGVTPEIAHILKDAVIILPETGKLTTVNVNTASAQVLAARVAGLPQSDAAALVASRQHAYFKDTNDFRTRLQGRTLEVGNDKISIDTNYFIVNGKVRLNRASLEMRALVERPPYPAHTTVKWTREN